MREVFGYHIKSISDHEHRELQPVEIYDILKRDFVNINKFVDVTRAVYTDEAEGIRAYSVIRYHGEDKTVMSMGNGRLDSVANALKELLGVDYTLESYTQHALEGKSTSKAASYVSIQYDGQTFWGVGIDSDIIVSSVKALVSAVNIMIDKTGVTTK